MTLLPRSIAVVGRLSDAFTADFVDYVHTEAKGATRLHVLWSADADGGAVERADAKYFDGSIITQISFGSADNEALVQRIIEENNVDVLFHFHYNDANASVPESARRVLVAQTHLLEAVRRCVQPPTLVVAFIGSVNSTVGSSLEMAADGTSRLFGKFCAASPADANFGSIVALLHSYAISYRLNIQVAHLQPNSESSSKLSDTLASLFALSRQDKVRGAPIVNINFVARQLTSLTKSKAAARFLIYGNVGDLLYSAICAQLTEYGAEYSTSTLCIESASWDELRTEILSKTPSHVIVLPSAESLDGNQPEIVYNAAGPVAVRKNAGDNLMAPLQLASVCEQLGGVHFNYANAHSLTALRDMLHLPPADTSIVQERDCFATTKSFTDATLALLERNSLNVVFESGKATALPKTAAQFLVNAALARKTGRLSPN